MALSRPNHGFDSVGGTNRRMPFRHPFFCDFTGYNDDQYFWTRMPGNDDGYVTVFNNDRHSDNEALISDSDIFMRPMDLSSNEVL